MVYTRKQEVKEQMLEIIANKESQFFCDIPTGQSIIRLNHRGMLVEDRSTKTEILYVVPTHEVWVTVEGVQVYYHMYDVWSKNIYLISDILYYFEPCYKVMNQLLSMFKIYTLTDKQSEDLTGFSCLVEDVKRHIDNPTNDLSEVETDLCRAEDYLIEVGQLIRSVSAKKKYQDKKNHTEIVALFKMELSILKALKTDLKEVVKNLKPFMCLIPDDQCIRQ